MEWSVFRKSLCFLFTDYTFTYSLSVSYSITKSVCQNIGYWSVLLQKNLLATKHRQEHVNYNLFFLYSLFP